MPEIPVIKGKAFPYLVRKNTVDVAACAQSSDTSYVELPGARNQRDRV